MATFLHRPRKVSVVAASSTGAGEAKSLVVHPDDLSDDQIGWWTSQTFDDKDAYITFDLGEVFRIHSIHLKAPFHGAPRFVTIEVYENMDIYRSRLLRDSYRFETESEGGMQKYSVRGVEGLAYGQIVGIHLSHASGMAFWIALNHILFYGVSMGEHLPEPRELFCDDWSGTSMSLGPLPVLKDIAEKGPIEWIRPDTFFRARDLILFSRVGPSDIRQGKLADCWLLAAFAAVAEVPRYIESLFEQREVNPFGKYVIRLFDPCAAVWTNIEIDDRIPCVRTSDGYESLGTSLTRDSELWVCLLEKAFARLGGSYFGIYGAYPTFALAVLVGSTKVHTLRKFEAQAATSSAPAKPAGWEKFVHVIRSNVATLNPVLEHDRWSDDSNCGSLRRNNAYIIKSLEFLMSSNYLVVVDTFGTSDREVKQGIVQKHAYTLLRVVLGVAGTKWNLLLLRNPWGHTEFEGLFSDGHPIWDEFPQVRKALHPEYTYNRAPKGTFWMCDDDFFRHFKSIYLCAHPVDGPRRWAVDLQEELTADVNLLEREASSSSFPNGLATSESLESVVANVKSHFYHNAWVEYFSESRRTWIPGFIAHQDSVASTNLAVECLDGTKVEVDLMTEIVRHRHVLYRAKRDKQVYYCIVVSGTKRKSGLCLKSVDGLRLLKEGARAEQLHEAGPPWSACHLAGRWSVEIPALNYRNVYTVRPDGFLSIQIPDPEGGLGHCMLMRFPENSDQPWRYLLKGHQAAWKSEKWRWIDGHGGGGSGGGISDLADSQDDMFSASGSGDAALPTPPYDYF